VTDADETPSTIDSSSIEAAVRSFAKTLPAGSRVLDVGCGLRPYERFFVGHHYVGVDVAESGRKSSDKRADIYFNGLNLPIADKSYDAVICTQVLEHSLQPDVLVAEMFRTLRGGGTGLVTVPLTWGEHEAPYDFRRYTTFGIRRLLEEAGYRVLFLGRITTGINAIASLVSSEINASARPSTSTLARNLLERLSIRWWNIQLRLWRMLYTFPRIYIDNVAHVQRPKE
jgi:SAM-dependent methyltransferase